MFSSLVSRASRKRIGSRTPVTKARNPSLESLEQRELLSTLVLPSTSLPAIAVTVPVNQDGNIFESDQNDWGGNFLGTLDGSPLSASYCVSIDLPLYTGSTYDGASVTNDGTIYGTAVPNAGAISWLLKNIGPKAATPFQQDALQAAIWRTQYGDTFQLDGVDNTNYEPTINSTAAPIYQADLTALGTNTAPVGNADWISSGADWSGNQGQGLVAMTATGNQMLALTNTVFPTFTVSLNLNLPDGNTFNESGQEIAGGNFLGTLDGTPLAATYCVAIDLGSAPPVTYHNASVTSDGTIYGTDVANAGAISWLLTNIGPTATTSDQQAALQAAIWRTEYGDGFQLDGVDNGNYAPDNSTIAPIYQADLFAVGDNTAPLDDDYWITTGPNPNTTEGQGLVAVPLESVTNTTVTSSANPSHVGQSVAFTATVANSTGNGAGTPTGSVQFQIDGRNYGSPVVLANGSASVSDAALGVGTHKVQAMYTPDTTAFVASTSGSYNQAVVAAAVTLGVLSPTQGRVNQLYTGRIVVSGGSGSYLPPTITGLPMGLGYGLAGKTITISGVLPTQSGQLNNIKVSLRDTNGTSVTRVYILTVTPAQPASVTVSAPSTVTEGVGFPITITVRDGYGNGVTGPVTLGCAGNGLLFNPEQVSPTTVNVANINRTATFTVTLASQAWGITLKATAGKVTGSSGTIIVLPPTLQWPSRYANLSNKSLRQPTPVEVQKYGRASNSNENPGVLWIVNGTNPENSLTPQMCFQFAFGPLYLLDFVKYQLRGRTQGTTQPQIGDIGLVFNPKGLLVHACIVVGRDSHGNWLFAQRNGVSPVFIGNYGFLESQALGLANANNIRFVPGR